MNASEVMTPNPIIAAPRENIREVFQRLIEHDVRHIPIVDNGELVGIVSDRDFREYSLPLALEVAEPDTAQARLEEPIGTIMRGNPVTVQPETELKDLVELLIEEKIGAVAVVDEHAKKLEGIISYVDILKAVSPLL